MRGNSMTNIEFLWNFFFIDAQQIIYKLKTRNKLNNLVTLNVKPMNKPKGFLGQTTNT